MEKPNDVSGCIRLSREVDAQWDGSPAPVHLDLNVLPAKEASSSLNPDDIGIADRLATFQICVLESKLVGRKQGTVASSAQARGVVERQYFGGLKTSSVIRQRALEHPSRDIRCHVQPDVGRVGDEFPDQSLQGTWGQGAIAMRAPSAKKDPAVS